MLPFNICDVLKLNDLFGSVKLLSEKWAHQQKQLQLSEKFPSSKSIKNEVLLPSEISFRASSHNFIGQFLLLQCVQYMFSDEEVVTVQRY